MSMPNRVDRLRDCYREIETHNHSCVTPMISLTPI